MAEKRKSYEELNFTDDFMFWKILTNNKDLCMELISIILDVKVKDIVYTSGQHGIDIAYDSKAVRLDVYVEDEKGSVYDIEMQSVVKKNIPKRSRYYQGMIDLSLVEKGSGYEELRECYVIFICLEDPFGRQLGKYTFNNKCEEDLSLNLNDGTHKIFLNTAGISDKLSLKLRDFLAYLTDNIPRDEFTRKLEGAVSKARQHTKWRLEFMSYIDRLKDEFEEGKEAGIELGRSEGIELGRSEGIEIGIERGVVLNLITMICRKLAKGKTPEVIADELDEDMEKVSYICHIAEQYAPDYDVDAICEQLKITDLTNLYE